MKWEEKRRISSQIKGSWTLQRSLQFTKHTVNTDMWAEIRFPDIYMDPI